MKKTKIITRIITIITILFFIVTPMVKATINPDDYKPANPDATDVSKIVDIANPIVGTIKVVGIATAAITIAVLGIKYMTGSISEKAEYKKTMIPYLVGAVLVVAITQLLGIVIEIVTEIQ